VDKRKVRDAAAEDVIVGNDVLGVLLATESKSNRKAMVSKQKRKGKAEEDR
jgi:hypothetical protein